MPIIALNSLVQLFLHIRKDCTLCFKCWALTKTSETYQLFYVSCRQSYRISLTFIDLVPFLDSSLLYTEPYQPHSIPPNWGGHAVTGGSGPKIPVPSPLSTSEKASIPKLKYEALEISEVRGPFERKVHYIYFGLLWKQSRPLIHSTCCWASFESKVGYFAHYSSKEGPEASATLAFP